jgi:hypothetical protein
MVLNPGKVQCSPCSRDNALRLAPGGSAPPCPSAARHAAMFSGRDGKAAPPTELEGSLPVGICALTIGDRLQKGALPG